MYTSDIRPMPREEKDRAPFSAARRWRRILAAFLAVSIFAFALDKIYALFAHGVSSSHMQWLFLYPLLGGCLVYGVLALARPGTVCKKGWRLGFNLYNAGLATLAVGSLTTGILEIAGTASAFTAWFFAGGAVLATVGLLALVVPNKKKSS